MNVIVANELQSQLTNLDADIIKNMTGIYSAGELVEMFKNFFYGKMILDTTSIKGYDDVKTYKIISEGLDVEKIIFFIPEGSSICTPIFLANLINLGIYNFTTNIDGVRYLLKNTNTYNDVAHIKEMGNKMGANLQVAHSETSTSSEENQQKEQTHPVELPKTIKLGVKNVTEHAGATSFIYMLKKELASVFGEKRVIAIEVNKKDFQFYNDQFMVSSSTNDLKATIEKYDGVSVILIDLNDCEDTSICNEILYLLEPSTLKLNKLVRRHRHIFDKIKNKKVILNKSLLSNKDVSDLEYEAGIRIYFNVPPVNDRKRNEVMTEFLKQLGLLNFSNSNGSGKIFGLFRR